MILLAGCGFEPLYAKPDTAADTNISAQLAATHIALIEDRVGQELRNHLLDKMNPKGQPQNPLFVLNVELNESRADLGIQRDDTSTFAKLVLSASYELRSRTTNEVLLNATARSTNSYNVLTSSYATLKAEEDARTRAAMQLSESITNRIAIYFSKQNRYNDTPPAAVNSISTISPNMYPALAY